MAVQGGIAQHVDIPYPGRNSQVKSAGRALDIVEALASERTGLGFAELQRSQRIPKSSLHALLGVLTDRGWVEFDAAKRTYALGIRTWETGQAYLANRDLVEIALPAMERIVKDINETVQLAVLDGTENVYLAKVDCSHPVRLQSEVGRRLHAHATGLGKMLLAGIPSDVLAARFDGFELPRVSPRTIRDVRRLFAVLDGVRQRGFAIDDQEYTEGLRCVAVPIIGIDGQAIAALSASVPITRAGPESMAVALRRIARASIEITRQLGGSSPDGRLASLVDWQGDVMVVGNLGVDGRAETGHVGVGEA